MAVVITKSPTAQWAPGSVNLPVAEFPTSTQDILTNAEVIATEIIDSLNQALRDNDSKRVGDLFCKDGYWRDHVALSWDLGTFKGKDKIVSFLAGGHNLTRVEIDRSSPDYVPQLTAFNPFGNVQTIRVFTIITTKHGSGRGLVNLVQEDGNWKFWTFYTALDELRGFEEPLGPNRAKGVQHGAILERRNWLDRRTEETKFENSSPDVIVIGCGQAGLTIHARLKMLGVPTLVIDATDEVGDGWRNRYHQLVLHDPVWFDHLPYINFPKLWPIYTPKDKLAEFFKAYAQLLELNVWTKTTVDSTSWDDDKKQWDVVLKRRREDGSTETRTLHPKNIVQATGHSGKANKPDIKGIETFQGDRICHSSEFRAARKNRQGKKAVVIGSCNSAMDICQAYYEADYDVTIVQRSSTAVAGCDTVAKLLLGGLYREDGPPLEDADLLLWGVPTEVLKANHQQLTAQQIERDAKLINGLQNAGFKVDFGPDDCGIFMKYFQRGGGYYFDVGSAQLIADGSVKVKQGQEVSEIMEHGLKLTDGTELEADEIIIATGYQNMRTTTEQIFGTEVADRVGDVWGFGPDGELRAIWRKTGQPGLWLMGGNLAMCRYYSRVLALQIKAQLEGLSK
ncbi:dimethylaniline monooxygenase (N-oxide forming) [Pseudomassariella vexata]|uniref:Dimethylaniline monooxygenase (N-oxide forming) n=1 Tax=Pseudomassariella vexata TaxID=1141098 RepID=A0A1Y2E115_9PEZI|nr:dimethylaniline monooxygenase (N-oxide forming) [Pseudomassariella vexata]ORY65169.1 dimethylaniline monooxygenase (N-oxide forming) [Pseudomassariella vexata]